MSWSNSLSMAIYSSNKKVSVCFQEYRMITVLEVLFLYISLNFLICTLRLLNSMIERATLIRCYTQHAIWQSLG